MSTEIPYFEDADSAPKPGFETIERDMVNVIVYNPRTDEVICLDWEKFGWKTFILGGTDGEDPVTASLREVHEETGYKNLKFIADLGKTRSGYHATHKSENRIANATGLLFELVDETQDQVDSKEAENHVFKWIPRNEVETFLTLSSQKYIWDKAKPFLP